MSVCPLSANLEQADLECGQLERGQVSAAKSTFSCQSARLDGENPTVKDVSSEEKAQDVRGPRRSVASRPPGHPKREHVGCGRCDAAAGCVRKLEYVRVV